ncbi:unnamed protein product [Euphydryas editha]|uniref:Uncharacterized protein n=1 Tax=Euphydryas editha TaxID=104508 RepID=A0AAU9UYY8_EUPED|nr:unnamed protein product [Euphydryas editha]
MNGTTDKKTLYSYVSLREKKYSGLNYNYTNNTALYANFVPFLMDLSMKLLRNVHDNIKNNYGLSKTDIKILEDAFKSSRIEYHFILKDNIKIMMDKMNYNYPEVLLLDFTDFSNYLIQIIIESNLNKLSGEVLSKPSYAYNYLLKYSILRQQMKIVINIIEVNICDKFSICVQKSDYSEYLTEWLRYILNANNVTINKLFYEISRISKSNLYNSTTMIKFHHKLDIITASGCIYQRSAIDFLDEVVSGHDIIKFVNRELRKYVILFKNLFEIVDENYEVNTTNEKELDKISKRLHLWIESENFEIRPVLEDIVDNIWYNVQKWPTKVQINLRNICTEIITLK